MVPSLINAPRKRWFQTCNEEPTASFGVPEQSPGSGVEAPPGCNHQSKQRERRRAGGLPWVSARVTDCASVKVGTSNGQGPPASPVCSALDPEFLRRVWKAWAPAARAPLSTRSVRGPRRGHGFPPWPVSCG